MYSFAFQQAPHDVRLAHYAREVHGRKIAAMLKPWGMAPQDYTTLVHRRLEGASICFPWEAEGRDLDAECARESGPSAPLVMARPLASAASSVAARHGIKLPDAQQVVLHKSDFNFTIHT